MGLIGGRFREVTTCRDLTAFVVCKVTVSNLSLPSMATIHRGLAESLKLFVHHEFWWPRSDITEAVRTRRMLSGKQTKGSGSEWRLSRGHNL
jgi:hypothetical protein